MSLTRKEWEEMWKAIKTIEEPQRQGESDLAAYYKKEGAIKLIKTKIQQVIGQME